MFELVVGTYLVLYGAALALNICNFALRSAQAGLNSSDKDQARPVFFRIMGGIGVLIGVSLIARFMSA